MSSACSIRTAKIITGDARSWRGISKLRIFWHCGQGAMPMTDEQLAAMHRLLAEHHRRLAKEAVLDVVQQYHSDLAQRLSDEAVLIPRRTAIVERLHEREQQKMKDGDANK
jgi:hypothetical protein